jgi:hypothetical protein
MYTATTIGPRGSAKLDIISFRELSEADQSTAAKRVAVMIANRDKEGALMIEVTPEEILAKHLGVLACLSLDARKPRIVGYAGILEPVMHRPNGSHESRAMAEVGSLIVDRDYQQRGIGHVLFRAATHAAQEEEIIPYAFCNSNSLSIAQSSGYRKAIPGDIPESAYDLCAQCPSNPLAQNGAHASTTPRDLPRCCDTVMVYDANQPTRNHTTV